MEPENTLISSVEPEGPPPEYNDDQEEQVKAREILPYIPPSDTFWDKYLCNPDHRLHKYIALFLMCSMGFGSYFAYDSPAALQDHITKDMQVSTSQFTQLYSMYSWPNVVLCFFGGYLIDVLLGIRWGAIIFSTFILLGQVIVAVGAFVNKFWVMDLGRFVFGIGGESLAVAQNAYAVSWFKDNELNFVFGLQLSMSRVGSSVGLNTIVPAYDALQKHGNLQGYTILGIVMFITAGTCLYSCICAVILGGIDKRAERLLNRKAQGSNETIRFSDIKDFNVSFWYLTAICVFYYVCVMPFVSISTVFFKRKYLFSDYNANAVASSVYIISAVACPIFGYLIDWLGRNLTWVFVSVIMTLLAHCILAFTFINPWLPMVIMGFGYSILACALWPMVALIIPEHQLGTAYGIIQAVQNLGLAAVPMIMGELIDSKGYIVMEVFLLALMCVTVIFVVLLYMSDESRDGMLNMSSKVRKELLAKQEAQKKKEEDNGSTVGTSYKAIE